MRRIIINADDLGRSQNINECILHCFKNGLITDSSIMVNMPGSEDAFNKFSKTEYSIGIHFVLSSDNGITNAKPLTPIRGITDKNGFFYSQDKEDFWDLIENVSQKAVYNELKAQLDVFIDGMGKKPSNITSHHHIHGSANLLPVFCRIAEEYSIPLRLPIRKSEIVRIPFKSKRLIVTDHFATDYKGNIHRATPENFINSIKKYSTGTIEIMVHPGFSGTGVDTKFNTWWSRELKVLKSEEVRNFLKNNKLISYLDLSQAR